MIVFQFMLLLVSLHTMLFACSQWKTFDLSEFLSSVDAGEGLVNAKTMLFCISYLKFEKVCTDLKKTGECKYKKDYSMHGVYCLALIWLCLTDTKENFLELREQLLFYYIFYFIIIMFYYLTSCFGTVVGWLKGKSICYKYCYINYPKFWGPT